MIVEPQHQGQGIELRYLIVLVFYSYVPCDYERIPHETHRGGRGEGLHVGRAAVPVVSADAFEVIPAAGSGTETPAVSFPPWECSVLRDACPCLCGGELWSAVVSCCGGA